MIERSGTCVSIVLRYVESWGSKSSQVMNEPEIIPIHIEAGSIRHLEGMVLTLVEAVTADHTQREAIKSLARQTVWNWGREVQFGYTQEEMNKMQPVLTTGTPINIASTGGSSSGLN